LFKKLNVLIIGGGMYVCGRGSSKNDFGTILPAVLEARKNNLIENISVATTSNNSSIYVKKILNKLSKLINTDNQCNIFPKNNNNSAYLDAIKNEKPDVCIICVPDHLHCKIAVDVMNLKIHCLIVKPLTTSLKNAKLMTRIANKNKLIAQVEFHKRYDESNLVIRDYFRKGLLGDLLYASNHYSQKKIIPSIIFKKWASKTNIFQYLGVHYVDLIYFITNFKPKYVTAWGQKEYLIKKNINTFDSIQAVIEWEKPNKQKFISTHLCNWIDPNNSSAMSDQQLLFVGTKGRIQADQKNRGLEFIGDDNNINAINPYFNLSKTSPIDNKLNFSGCGITSILTFFNDVLNFKSKKIKLKDLNFLRPSFNHSVISTAVIESVSQSLNKKNKKITINI